MILYQVLVQFLKSTYHTPWYINKSLLWQNLKYGLLEQYKNVKSVNNKKRMKLSQSLTRRAKMRIVGIICLLALDIAFWKISINAMKILDKI